MRKEPNVKIERYRTIESRDCSGTNCGSFIYGQLRIIASDGGGWDHVSVSLADRCPTWAEMCEVKDLFFRDDEVVIQLHPAKANHINMHPFCLHLWRPQSQEERDALASKYGEYFAEWPTMWEIPVPPTEMVGF